MRFLRRSAVFLNRTFGIRLKHLGIRTRIELHTIRSRTQRVLHHHGIGIHKDTHTHPIGVQMIHYTFQKMKMPTCVVTVIRGQLRRVIGHKGHLRRLDIRHQSQEIIRRISLNVELRSHHRLEHVHVLLTNMPFVRTRMNGNTLRAKQLAIHCKTLNVRHISTTRIAQCGYLVDVYA